MSPTSRIRVRVPATTSNLGPGFDALGLALALENSVTVTVASELSIEIAGEGAGSLPRDRSNVMFAAIERGCREAGIAMPALRLECRHQIPTARGLGSSAAAVVAGFTIADALANGALGRDRVLALATEIEGHPDNAAPAVFGGLQSSVLAQGRVHRITVPVRECPAIVLFVPEFEMATRDARAVLPASVSRADAVFNIARTAMLVSALTAGRPDLLGVATEDAIHQTPRQKLFPGMPVLFAAGRDAGAHAAWLSGAGSTIATFAPAEISIAVGAALERAAHALGVAGRTVITRIDERGASWERVE